MLDTLFFHFLHFSSIYPNPLSVLFVAHILKCFTLPLREKTPPANHLLSEITQTPAVHSQGALLLLAVSRPTWEGSKRENEWVAGGEHKSRRGGKISQLLVHKLCPPVRD